MLFVLGQVYDRELGDLAKRDRDLPARSSTSIPTTTTPPRRSTGCIGQAERWYDLLAILERQVELAPTTGETVVAQVPHRPAVAEHLKDLGARGRGVPRRR